MQGRTQLKRYTNPLAYTPAELYLHQVNISTKAKSNSWIFPVAIVLDYQLQAKAVPS